MLRTMGWLALAFLLFAPGARGQGTPAGGEPTFQDRPLSAWMQDLNAPAPYTRNAAAYAISSMGPAAKSAVPALIASLEDPAAAVRFPVAYALGEIGPDAIAAVPALTKTMDDVNDDVAFMARKAIKKITGTAPEPPQ
ncbi:MAG: HEAT repeat domain-containing protein [Gemmatimonadales bacterium]